MIELIKFLAPIAMKFITEKNKLKDVEISGWEADIVPSLKKPIYRFHVIKKDDSNGPSFDIVLDETGAEVDIPILSKKEKYDFFTPFPDEEVLSLNPPIEMFPSRSNVIISPDVNDFTLNSGQVYTEEIHVKIPAVPNPLFDVYFLADSTFSMNNVIASVKTGATNIMNTLHASYPNMAFGVGDYKDFCSQPADPYCFKHQLSPTTNVANVQTAINSWNVSGGDDLPEGQLYALDQIATNPAIGWRAGAIRIVVWFGDYPGHDPICAGLPGVTTAITEAIATSHLVSSKIKVLAISVGADLLNGTPTKDNYPCANAGTAGQAVRISTATGGSYTSGVNSITICSTIISMVTAATNIFNNINLSPAGSVSSLITSITPSAGYGPVSGSENHDYIFHVTFTGPPCDLTDKIYTGFINVIGNGRVVARKKVKITIPSCQNWYYGVKFLCGYVKEGTVCATLRPGIYSTDINILNYSDKAITVHKYLYPLMKKGEGLAREPKAIGRKIEDKIDLKPNTATFDDCIRLHELADEKPLDDPLSIGFFEIVSPVELVVTAVYTAGDMKGTNVSIDVEQITGKYIKR
jgi:hypothetical protein